MLLNFTCWAFNLIFHIIIKSGCWLNVLTSSFQFSFGCVSPFWLCVRSLLFSHLCQWNVSSSQRCQPLLSQRDMKSQGWISPAQLPPAPLLRQYSFFFLATLLLSPCSSAAWEGVCDVCVMSLWLPASTGCKLTRQSALICLIIDCNQQSALLKVWKSGC